MKCSYYQFQGGPSTHIHGFHFQQATKAERWLRYVEMYTYYVHVYVHTHKHIHTHVAISRASVTRREIYGFERERSEDGRKQEMRRSNDRKPFSSDFQRFRRQQPPCQRCLELPLLRSDHIEKTAPLKRVRYLLRMKKKNTSRVHTKKRVLTMKNIYLQLYIIERRATVSLRYRLSFTCE